MAGMPLNIQRTRESGLVLLRCQGMLTIGPGTSALLESGREAMATPGTSGLLLDLSEVERLDSAGMGALVNLMNECGAKKIGLAIHGMTPRIKELLAITRLDGVLPCYPDEQAARAAFTSRERRAGRGSE